MRVRRFAVAVLGVIAPVVAAHGQAGDPRVVAGDWVFRMEGDASPQRVELRADGDSVRGSVYGQPLVGTLAGDRLVFRVGDYNWRATLSGDELRGRLRIGTDSSALAGPAVLHATGDGVEPDRESAKPLLHRAEYRGINVSDVREQFGI